VLAIVKARDIVAHSTLWIKKNCAVLLLQ